MLQAIENGAVAYLGPEVEGSEGSENSPLPVPVIQLPNPLEAMGRLGAAFYNEPSQKMTIVGVSGQLLNKACIMCAAATDSDLCNFDKVRETGVSVLFFVANHRQCGENESSWL